jgi:hypothetical protein
MVTLVLGKKKKVHTPFFSTTIMPCKEQESRAPITPPKRLFPYPTNPYNQRQTRHLANIKLYLQNSMAFKYQVLEGKPVLQGYVPQWCVMSWQESRPLHRLIVVQLPYWGPSPLLPTVSFQHISPIYLRQLEEKQGSKRPA